jgi:CTP:molybdopterin cytidylyltransferase MocA
VDRIGALILAAAGGEAFGGSLALAPWGDRALVEYLVAITAPHVDRVIVVLGADAEGVLAAADLGEATVVINPEWELGPTASLRVGLDLFTRDGDVDAVLVVDADQPQLDASVVAEVVAAHRDTRAPIMMPKYRYERGGPILIARDLWPRAIGLGRDATLGALVKAHPEWTDEVWVDRVPPHRVRSSADLAEMAPRH